MKNFEELTLNDYVAIIRRRVWYLIATTILVSIGVVVYVWQMKPEFKSETTILMSNRLLPEDYIRSIDRESANDRLDFVKQQLQSRAFLQGIVLEFHLAKQPDRLESAAESVRKKTDITVLTPSAFKLSFVASDPKLAQVVTRRLAERLIELNDSFRKEKVQIADQFLEEQLSQASDELEQTEEKLAQFRKRAFPGLGLEAVTAETVRDLQAQLAGLETRLQSAVSERKGLEQRLEEQRKLRMITKAAPIASRAPSGTSPQAVSLTPSHLEEKLATKRAELATLMMRYTPAHPEVVRLSKEVNDLEAQVKAAQSSNQVASVPKEEIKPDSLLPQLDSSVDFLPAEIRFELEQVTGNIETLDRSRKDLLSKIAAYQSRLNPAPEVEQQLAGLTRDYESAKQRYSYLSERRFNSDMATRVDASDDNEMFRILDAAYLPQSPISPPRRLLAAVGSLAGILVGFGVAFLREYLDHSLQEAEDAAKELKLPVLASIPNVPGEKNSNLEQARALTIVRSQEADNPAKFSLRSAESKLRDVVFNRYVIAGEHYRMLHAKLSLMQKERPLKTIMVVSALPNEGKTFAACCLAATLAQEPGKKVLLIDADLRTSSATMTLGLGHRKSIKGLDKILSSEQTIENSLLKCSESELYVLPTGAMEVNPAQVLSSPEFGRMLREFSTRFDWVIIDSPPLLAVADAILLSPLCDAALLVARAGKTSVKLIKEAIQRIGPARICGLVMNGVNITKSAYYQSQYYRSLVDVQKTTRHETQRRRLTP